MACSLWQHWWAVCGLVGRRGKTRVPRATLLIERQSELVILSMLISKPESETILRVMRVGVKDIDAEVC